MIGVAVLGRDDAKPFVCGVGVIGCLALLREYASAVLHFKHVLRGINAGSGQLRWSGSEFMRHVSAEGRRWRLQRRFTLMKFGYLETNQQAESQQ